MVEDTPNDLVHDIAAEAVFGSHPLGRPVIGSAEVISSVSRRALAVVPPARVSVRQDRPRSRGQRPPRRADGDARERRNGADPGPGLAARKGVRAHGKPGRPLPAQGHRAVPRVPQRARDLARSTTGASRPRSWTRSSAARRRHGSSRRSARSAGWRTRSTATRRSTPTRGRSASTSARVRTTSPSASRSRSRSSRTSLPATFDPTSSRARRRTSRAASCSRWSRPPRG